jgi:hypothetical protein
MFSYGHKTVTKKYASIQIRPGEKLGSASYNNLQSMIGLTKAISMDMGENMRQRYFEYSLSQIKLAERGRPLTVGKHTVSRIRFHTLGFPVSFFQQLTLPMNFTMILMT